MIDIENQVFTKLADNLELHFPGICVYSDITKTPASFPAVFAEEKDNIQTVQYKDSSYEENFSDLVYEINVYTASSAKKAQAKKIAQLIDDEMKLMGFLRIMANSVANFNDSSIYRITLRYRCTVSKNQQILRR